MRRVLRRRRHGRHFLDCLFLLPRRIHSESALPGSAVPAPNAQRVVWTLAVTTGRGGRRLAAVVGKWWQALASQRRWTEEYCIGVFGCTMVARYVGVYLGIQI